MVKKSDQVSQVSKMLIGEKLDKILEVLTDLVEEVVSQKKGPEMKKPPLAVNGQGMLDQLIEINELYLPIYYRREVDDESKCAITKGIFIVYDAHGESDYLLVE